MKKAPILVAAAFAVSLTACQATPQGSATSTPAPVETTADPAAPSFVQAVCGDCHAVEPPWASPNSDAPTFDAIANMRGVNRNTLVMWLSDAHNYPDEMEFDLEENWVDVTADYLVTLKREDYTPDP